MLSTPHVMTGTALALTLPFPWGLPLAILSHFFLDFAVPHWNPHLYTEMKKSGRLSRSTLFIIAADGLLSMIFLWWLIKQNLPAPLVISAAFLSVLPDLMEIPYYFFGSQNSWLKNYVNFEHLHQAKAGMFWGIATQLTAIVLSMLLISRML